MADFLRVACSCGCENRVPVEQRGRPATCAACGNDLVAEDRGAAVPAPSSPDRAPPEPAAIVTPTHPRSPFEADPAIPEVEQNLSPMERAELLRQRENRARGLFVESASLRDGFTDETCSQCGKELRGDWDRLQTAGGVICYICSNQATHGIPERLKASFANGARSRRGPVRRVSADSALLPPWRDPRWQLVKSWFTKGVCVLLGCLVFSLTLYYLFFDPGAPAGASRVTAAPPAVLTPRDLADLPMPTWVFARSWMVASVIVPIFVALYLVRFFSGSLPGNGILGNIGDVALSCSPILLIQLVTIGVEALLPGIPALVIFSVLVLPLLQLWALLNIFLDLMEDDLWQSLSFVLVLQVFSQFCVPYLNLILFRGLGLI